MTENPPFRAAILESGTGIISPASAIQWSLLQPGLGGPPWPALASRLGCAGTPDEVFQCIKTKPASQLKYFLEHDRLSFPQVVVDNDLVYPDLYQRRVDGKVAKVPILLGSNSQEFRVFTAVALVAYIPSLNPLDNIAAVLSYANETLNRFLPNGTLQEQATNEYPATNLALLPALDLVTQVATDLTFTCPAAMVANTSAAQGIPTWRYYYNATFPNTQPFLNAGCFHSSEIPQVFQKYVGGFATTSPPPTAAELELSDFFQTAWSQFAKDPQGGPGWTQYEASPNQIMAQLGGPDNPTGAADLSPSEVDHACQLYDPLIISLNSIEAPYFA